MFRIMVVDDEPDNIELMKIILAKHGFDPILYTAPKEALDALQNGALPDLLILDMHMPEIGGAEFCTELRKNPRFDSLKIVFFTASTDLTNELLNKYNVRGFIYKPFNIPELLSQINKFLTSTK